MDLSLVEKCIIVLFQRYEEQSYSGHHLKNFSCRIQLKGNPYEVIEAATEIHVLCKSML